MVYSEGDKYKGLILGKKREGFGRIKYKRHGNYYDGFWKDNMRDGVGIGTVVNSAGKNEGVYTGEWVNDKRYGKGTMNYSNQDCYQGVWKDGKRQGEGVMYFADG